MIVVFLLVVGVGTFFFFNKKSSTNSPATSAPAPDDVFKVEYLSPTQYSPKELGLGLGEEKFFRKTEDTVFYQDKLIEGADPHTFNLVAGMYYKDKKSVFSLACSNEEFYSCVKKIEVADPETFEVIGAALARDKNKVFLSGQEIPGLDPHTLGLVVVTLGPSRTVEFLKDSSSVYSIVASIHKLPGADPNTFKVISMEYSKDKNHVYMSWGDSILGADPATFELLSYENKLPAYAKDSKSVYYFGKQIKGADAGSFVAFGHDSAHYAKDNQYAYFEDKPFKADVATFKILNMESSYESFAIDKDAVYYLGKILPGADSETFVMLGEFYSKDKNFVYFKNRKVVGADLATFRANAYVALDKNHYYEFDKVLASPDKSQYGGWEDLGVKVSN